MRRTSRPSSDIIRVSPKNAAGLSDYRKAQIEVDIEGGKLAEAPSYENSILKKNAMPNPAPSTGITAKKGWGYVEGQVSSGQTRNGNVMPTSGIGVVAHTTSYKTNEAEKFQRDTLLKSATGIGTLTGGTSSTAGSQFERFAPEIYSPLFTMANLNLPRDRITINAWIRNYFLLHPVVRNVITLHSTYPISKINIRCADKKAETFFSDMMEEMDLLTTLGELSLEWWKMGEVFPYGEFDENTGKWSRFVIQNPDYINVRKSIFGGEPIISLRPDEAMRRLVMSDAPADVQIRKSLPDNMVYQIRAGHDISLDNFNITQLKMGSSPYDVRGTSIIVSIFKDLALWDKIRECYSADTEFLTEDGFKLYDDVNEQDKIGTFNKMGVLEYQSFTDRIKRAHSGEMYNFSSKKIDMLVTPAHRMWLSQKKSHGRDYFDFNFIEAQNIKNGFYYKTKNVIDWQGKNIQTIDVGENKVPVEQYLRTLGHLISEGCIHYNPNKYQYRVKCSQSMKPSKNDSRLSMRQSMTDFAFACGVHLGTHVSKNVVGFSTGKPIDMEIWTISQKFIAKHFAEEIGTNSHNKHIPKWVLGLSKSLLHILLDALIEGDGEIKKSKYGTNTIGYRYSTVSKQLANDVQELIFKCGFAPIIRQVKNGQGKDYFAVDWSNTQLDTAPLIYGNRKKGTKTGGAFEKIQYSGDVVCFTVPNEILITRRNGKIAIQGNCKFAQADGLINPITIIKVGGSTDGDYRATHEDLESFRQIFEEAQYDKNASIITHAGVTVERIGASGQVLETSEDMNLIIKNIYTGLMIPPAVIDQEGSTYASASIGLEVLRQRYFNFRNLISKWLINKVFAPISEVQGFYEYVDGTKKLIVPEIEWNQMNLYDLDTYIGQITGLVGSKQASLKTLYHSLGLNYEDEKVNMRKEAIDLAIRQREEQAMATMTLDELRTLDPQKEIREQTNIEEREQMGAGAAPGGAPGGMPDMGGLGGPPPGGGGMGGMPELTPPPALEGGGGAGAPPVPGGAPPLGPGTGPPGPGM